MLKKDNLKEITLTKKEVEIDIEVLKILKNSFDFLIQMAKNRDLDQEIKDSLILYLKDYFDDINARIFLRSKYLKDCKLDMRITTKYLRKNSKCNEYQIK